MPLNWIPTGIDETARENQGKDWITMVLRSSSDSSPEGAPNISLNWQDSTKKIKVKIEVDRDDGSFIHSDLQESHIRVSSIYRI